MLGGIDTALFGGYDDLEGISPIFRAGIYLTPEELPADASLVTHTSRRARRRCATPAPTTSPCCARPRCGCSRSGCTAARSSEFTLRRWGPSGDAFRAGRQPLRGYLDHAKVAPSVDNTITRFLAWPHPALARPSSSPRPTTTPGGRRDRAAGLVRARQPAREPTRSWPTSPSGSAPSCATPSSTSAPRCCRACAPTSRRAGPRTRAHLDHRCRLDVRVWNHVAARVLPDKDPAAVLEAAFEKSVKRYNELLQRPYDASLLRGSSTAPTSSRPR